MPIDGFVIYAVSLELNEKLLNGRIDKIHQPEKDELVISVRNNNKTEHLLISANSSYPRITMSKPDKVNPDTAPSFCMLMRKHLKNGVITNIFQPDFDRIIIFEIISKNEMQEYESKYLIVEIMGKFSNIILTDITYTVLDCIKRINTNISRKRQLYPGIKYTSPPGEKKISPLDSTNEIFLNEIKKFNKGNSISTSVINSYYGISPLIIEEICFLMKIDSSLRLAEFTNAQFEEFSEYFHFFAEKAKTCSFTPGIYCNDSGIIDFYCFNLRVYDKYRFLSYNSVCSLINDFYLKKELHHRLSQKSSDIKKTLTSLISKNEKKINLLKNDLESAGKRDLYRKYGELLLANTYISNSESGRSEIDLNDFFTNRRILIPLDPRLSLTENAQKYFKRYNKLKNAQKILSEQLAQTKEELEYLYGVALSIDNAENVKDIDEIKNELMDMGYIRYKKNKKNVPDKSDVLKHVTEEGYEIYIGKNNKQNDYLTHKFADKHDIWLHAENMPGSHVIIRTNGRNVPDSVLEKAASYAAYFSKGKNSSKIPVIYTGIKNIKKPADSKPGFVIFNTYNTLVIHPDKPEAFHSEIIT